MNAIDILVLGHLERSADGSVDLNGTWSTSALIRTEDGHNIVTDTSMPYMGPALKTSFRQVGKIFPDDVDMVVLTHTHSDHIGNNCLFPNASFYVREEESANIPNSVSVTSDIEIAEGVRLVHTPGHTEGSMSIFVESDRRYAIVGDAIPLRANYDKGVPPRLNCDSDEAVSSMRKIIRWADVIVPGHDRPFSVRKK